jgi:hypothetical protein
MGWLERERWERSNAYGVRLGVRRESYDGGLETELRLVDSMAS